VGKIFISYRREDSATMTGRMYDWLTLRLPKEDVFIDIDSVGYGANFVQRIQETIPKCKAVLVVIGPHWLGQDGAVSPYVRMEVEMALSKGVQVIPVLVDGATMPAPQQLPETMRTLVYLNAASVRTTGRDFQRDMGDLGKEVGIPLAIQGGLLGAPWNLAALAPRHRWITAGALITGVGLSVFAYYLAHQVELSHSSNSAPQMAIALTFVVTLYLVGPLTALMFLIQALRKREGKWLLGAVLAPVPGILVLGVGSDPVTGWWAVGILLTLFLLSYGWLGDAKNASRNVLIMLILLSLGTGVFSFVDQPKELVAPAVLVSPSNNATFSLAAAPHVTLSWTAVADRDHRQPNYYTVSVLYCARNCPHTQDASAYPNPVGGWQFLITGHTTADQSYAFTVTKTGEYAWRVDTLLGTCHDSSCAGVGGGIVGLWYFTYNS
jgi:hypothetical protein